MSRFYLYLYDLATGRKRTGSRNTTTDIEFHEHEGILHGSMDLACFYDDDKPLIGSYVEHGDLKGVELKNIEGGRAFKLSLILDSETNDERYYGTCRLHNDECYMVLLIPK